MVDFQYFNEELFAEEVSLSKIATEVATPFYCYSAASLKRNFNNFEAGLNGLDAKIFYAVKANSNIGILATLAQLGAGADIVSGGELERALISGFSADNIIFSGVGKTREELQKAISSGIKQFNIESRPELIILDKIATEMNVRAPIAIRVNPNIDAGTHFKITTGKSENKFGIDIEKARSLYAEAHKLKGICIKGVAVHIGSQLTDLTPYRNAYIKVRELVHLLRADGHSIDIVDLGGGLGIVYEKETPPSPIEYGTMVKEVMGDLECFIGFEPGRVLVGNAGIIVARVIYVKEEDNKRFLIIDAAMNDLLRPALYEAFHNIIPIKKPKLKAQYFNYDIVGPICETSDTFGYDRALPKMKRNDLVAICATGAYGAVMASTYNSRPLVSEIMVKANQYAVIATALSTANMMSREAVPPWIEPVSEKLKIK